MQGTTLSFPLEKHIRDLAWVVVLWAQRVQPAVIMLENVEEFRTWGPLGPDGRPDKARAGEEYERWCRQLRKAGYRLQWRELRACDYGAPTSRKRFFLIARRDGLPIVWPEPTHGKPGSPEVLSGRRLPWRTAAEVIDWTIPCPSIFERARPLKDATNRRIAHGIMRFVVNAARPFIVPVTNGGWAPERAWSADEPLRTMTTAKGGEFAAVAPSVVPLTHHGDDRRAYDPSDPLPTVTGAHRGELAAIGATLIQTSYGERPGQEPRVPGLDKPLGTAVAGGIKHAPVAAFLSKFASGNAPTGADEPTQTIEARAKHAVVAACLSHQYGSNTNGGRGDPEQPAKTITTGGHHAILAVHMEQANTGRVGHPVTAPVSTIMVNGVRQRLVETTLVPADALPPAMMARAVTVAAFLIKYYGEGGQWQGADQPLGTVPTRDRFAVVTVTIDEATYILVDIGMRMLTPRELARAQGFSDSYDLEAAAANGGKPLTKTAQTRMLGNSVCPPLSKELVRANFADFVHEKVAA